MQKEFCQESLIQELIKLGKLFGTNQIYPRSHKCEFRFDKKTELMNLRIRKNSYSRMTIRTISWEHSTYKSLLKHLIAIVVALDHASELEIFAENYNTIRDGLYALIIVYNYNKEIQRLFTIIVDSLKLKEQ